MANKDGWVRLTGLFKNKQNPSQMGGYVKGEKLQELLDEVQKAVSSEGQLNITVWKNKADPGKPIASVTVKAGPVYDPKSGPKKEATKNTEW